MREYFCAYHTMLAGTRKLSDAECGRLFRALLQYSAGADVEQIKLQGREEVLFDVYAQQIDRDIKSYDAKIKAQHDNGKKGGRPKKADGSCENPNNPWVFSETQITQEKEKEEDKEKDKEKDKEEPVVCACAHEALPGADTLEAYATSNLQYMSYSHMQELASFKADMPEELIRHAIDEACAAGKRAWAYTRAILNRYLESKFKTVGDVKAAEEKRTAQRGTSERKNPALNYQQREYTEEDYKSVYFDLEKFFAEEGTT